MAAENVIEVVLRSVNEMSKDLASVQAQLGQLTKAADTTTVSTNSITRASGRWHSILGPLRSLLVQTTEATGAMGTAIFNLIRFGLTPVGLAIVSITTITTSLVSKWNEAKKAAEEFNKELNVNREQLSALNAEYRSLADENAPGFIKMANAMEEAARKVRLAQAAQLQTLIDQIAAERSRARPPAKFLIEDAMKFWFGIPTQEDAIAVLEARLSVLRTLTESGAKQAAKIVAKQEYQKILADMQSFRLKELEELTKGVDEIETELSDPSFANNIAEAVRAGLEEADKKVLADLRELTFAWEEELAEDVDEAYSKVREVIRKDNEEIAKNAEELAADMAKSFTDRFIALMEGEKPDVLGFFRNLGRTIVSELLQELLKAQLIGPLKAALRAGETIPGTATGFLGFGSFFKSLFGFQTLPGQFRQVPGSANQPVPAIVHGGEVIGRPTQPTWNVIIQGDIVPRQPNMRPQDVVLVVADDMERGGKTARAAINLQKRR